MNACYECGEPAAYRVTSGLGGGPAVLLRCASCAAYAAAHGETIEQIKEEN